MLDRLVDEGDDVTFDRETLGALQVPANLEAVAVAIDQMRSTDPARTFQDALMELDRVVARLFEMSLAAASRLPAVSSRHGLPHGGPRSVFGGGTL
jgi:hypothetical protein